MTNANEYLVEGKVNGQNNFSANAGSNIGYEKGAKMVKNFYDQNPEGFKASFLGRDIIESLLAQPGVVGISILNGMSNTGELTPVLVGVNAKGDYVLNVTTVNANGQMVKEKAIVASGVISPGTTNTPPPDPSWF